jgi:hypothetical protein
MKPLLKWRSPDDQKFRDSLQRRLRSTVLRGWKRTAAEDEKKRREAAEFLSTPVTKRLEAVRQYAIPRLRKFGFKDWQVMIPHLGGPYGVRISPQVRLVKPQGAVHASRIISWNHIGKTCRVVALWTMESLNLRPLRDEFGYSFISSGYQPPHFSEYDPNEEWPELSVEHHVLCSLKPVPRARVMSALPIVHWDESKHCYAAEITVDRGRAYQKSLEREPLTTRVIHIHIIGDVKSFAQFRTDFDKVLEVTRSEEYDSR